MHTITHNGFSCETCNEWLTDLTQDLAAGAQSLIATKQQQDFAIHTHPQTVLNALCANHNCLQMELKALQVS